MKKHNNAALKWILSAMRPQLLNIILLAIIYGTNAFIGVYNTGFARQLVDAAVGGVYNEMLYYGAAFLIITIVQIVTLVLSRNLVFVISTKLEMTIRSRLFKEMLNKDFSDITAYHSGELMNRLTNDVGVISNSISVIIPNVVYFIVKIIGVFYVLISIDVLFALVFVIIGVLVIFAASLFKPITKRQHKAVQETDGKVRSFMQESLSSLLMIKTFDAGQKISDSADELQDINYAARRRRNILSILTGTSMSTVFSLAFVWGLIWGAFNIFTGNITYGTLMQIITLVGQIRTPIQGMTSIFPTYFTALASAERIMEIEQLPDEATVNQDIDPQKIYSEMRSIEVRDVSFAFDRDILLEDTSISINKGDFVVIEGISGIGKSTLLKLMLAVYKPVSGEIYIDTGDNKLYADKSLRRIFSYVPQGNFLLSGTLRENIAFVAPEADDEEIMKAADIACATEFINELPEGLDTKLSERGGGLSEGQVQRIAIARAILSGAPVILLDEATSALDEDTERRLLSNLQTMQNKTCVIVSHKKAAEDICNRRITIKDKKIIE